MSSLSIHVAHEGGFVAKDESSTTTEVWIDGACPLCARSRRWCEERDRAVKIRFRNFRAIADYELPLQRARMEQSLWVRRADGAMLDGYDGWREILALLPGWRWLAVVSGLPPLSWLGPPLYRLVARHRHRLAR
jgi:predicted DCC family thiol-disulfide oxidoreductase YuxK